MFNPTVSIVVNTLNRGESLRNTLRGLSDLAYENVEVVVVNGPSTDTTETVLEEWRDRIKIGHCDVANLSVSRNVGIGIASGEIVAFIDDDAVPHPQWLTRLVTKYADPLVGAVGGFTVDNTGGKFQCKKTLCDRFGNAFFVSTFFDERPLNKPGSPIYPSLLGTNSSFRREALQEIGGFDHSFAYLLDETDVCLRIVDAGYKVLHESSALIFHQFAASHIRTSTRVARTVYPSATSKAYFIMRHGARQSVEEAGLQLTTYREEILKSNQWLSDNGRITLEHRVSLDQDLMTGISEGVAKAYAASDRTKGHLSEGGSKVPFKRFPTNKGLRVAFVSQSFPPEGQAGIARWTWMVAGGLAKRGHSVHVVTRAREEASTRFENGYWIHALPDDPVLGEVLAVQANLPHHIASRCAAVKKATAFVKSFGLDVLSFPIWDVEGLGCIEDPDLAIVMSLHTTYSLAKPHKKEWQTRPLFEYFAVDPVISAEARLLQTTPTIIANSGAIVSDLEKAHSISLGKRVTVCPHGTVDPYKDQPARRTMRNSGRAAVRVLFAGRFEERKGFDIAALVFSELLARDIEVRIDVVGDVLSSKTEGWLREIGAARIMSHPRVHFEGILDRGALDDKFATVDVVLMPSRYESFGLVAIEAMSAGAVVVALAAGGLAEVIEDGVSGVLVESGPNEVSDFVHKVVELVGDESRRRRLSEGARAAFAGRYTIERMVDGIEMTLAKACEIRKAQHGA